MFCVQVRNGTKVEPSRNDKVYVLVKLTPAGAIQKLVSPTSVCVIERVTHVPVFVNTSDGFVNAAGTLALQPVIEIFARLHWGSELQGGGCVQRSQMVTNAEELRQRSNVMVLTPAGKLKVILVCEPPLES